MDDAAVYLEKLAGFSRMLRLHDFAVGPSETADAGKIFIHPGGVVPTGITQIHGGENPFTHPAESGGNAVRYPEFIHRRKRVVHKIIDGMSGQAFGFR